MDKNETGKRYSNSTLVTSALIIFFVFVGILMLIFPEVKEFVKTNGFVIAISISLTGLAATSYLNYKDKTK